MIKRFSEISSKDVATCGGKGASLGEMIQAGFSVPNGFVLTTKAFGKHHNEWKKQVYHAFDMLDTQFVAVRSSGTKEDGMEDSFAGQFETFLFVNRENLIEQIVACHEGLKSQRILSYCESKKIDTKQIKIAVVVQKMVNSEVAGVCFTVNPVTGKRDECMIEAGYGLGEAIVSGYITPDNYLVHKTSEKITNKYISQQDKKISIDIKQGGTIEEEIEDTIRNIQKLADHHIFELSKVAKKIEKHYGKPMDIERAVEDEKLYMLQARPITTLGEEVKKDINYDEREFEFQQRNRHPLMAADMWLRALSDYFKTESKLENIDERLDYIISADAKGWDKKKQKEKIMKAIRMKAKDFSYLQYICDTIQKRTEELEETKDYILKSYEKKSNEELAKLRKKFDSSFTQWIPWYWIPWYITEEDMLVEQVAAKVGKYKKEIEKICPLYEAVAILTFPSKKTYFQEAETFLKKVAERAKKIGINAIEIQKDIEKYIKDYGWLGTFLVLDIPIKDKSQIQEEIKALMKSSEKKEEQADIKKGEKLWQIIKKDKSLEKYILWAKEYGWILTKSVEDTFRITAQLQPFMRTLAKKIGIEYKDFSNYTPEEIGELLIGKRKINKKELLARRKGIVQISEQGKRKIWIGDDALRITEELNKIQNNDSKIEEGAIQGKSGYGGKITGIARICLGAQEAEKVREGDVLITSMTTPDFVPAMKRAVAVITDEGGMLCHAAIICRELKIPCVIGAKTATRKIKDGQKIQVDADNGIVTILEGGDKKYVFAFGADKIALNQMEAQARVFVDKKFPYFKVNDGFFLFQGTKMDCYFSQNDVEKLMPESGDKLQNKKIFEAYKRDLSKICRGVQKRYKSISKMDFKKKKTKELINEYKKLYMHLEGLFGFLNATGSESLGNIEKKIMTWLELKYDIKIANEVFLSITYPDELDDIKKEFIDWICLYDKKLPSKKTLLEHAFKYCWLFPDELDESRVYDYFIQREKKELPKDIKKAISDIYKQHEQNLAKKRKLIKGIGNSDITFLANIISFNTTARMWVKIFYGVNFIARNLIKRIGSAISEIPENIIYNYYLEDVVSGKKLTKEELKKRKEAKMLLIKEGKLNTLFGKKIIDEELKIIGNPTEINKINTFVGQIANMGKAKGRVQIVPMSDIKQLKQSEEDFNIGDVLVTTMTQPNMVPLIKKASSIITDQGGITCHAAIIARELNKPCIIGAKIATKMLKNGDFVEVDADNGIVTILDQHKEGPKKLVFAFREYIPLFSASKLVHTKDDYVVITKNRESECYYLGELKYINKKKRKINSNEIIVQLKKNNDEIRLFKPNIKEYDSLQKAIGLFKKIILLLQKRSDIYQLTEEVYWGDKKLSKALVDKIAKLRLLSKIENKKNRTLLFNSVLPRIAKYVGIGKKDIVNCTYDEIISLDKKIPSKKEVEKRQKIRGLIQENGKKRFLTASEIKKFDKQIKQNQKIKKNQLCGDIAYPGIVKGKVQIVKGKIKLSQIKKGSVLVTPMTRPDILQHIGKFKGIITDEGGILCHAAIIAREEKIPCIVGTHVATKKLKNGDLIELDATKGTIKIL